MDTRGKIVGWFSQLSLALAFIHEKNPVYSPDVKPENVFLTYGGSCVKLGDFGFTRTLANTMELALTRCGTPYYLSPEHCMNKAYNAKADVWAAGIVLYELLTLQVPFKGKTIMELRNNILRAPLKRQQRIIARISVVYCSECYQGSQSLDQRCRKL